ncbi:hypothetical protein EUGRSUZ_C03227 [Eucalyptus grandis]|uniref:Uncharacterized protein n=2 Tax=Eucalyptus grandis TaxID=71139 RepID=A0ACC3LI31_EUCGR|nr:hypothetical protein EUGRSUZ_C03227 [Eucalyptus grandis]
MGRFSIIFLELPISHAFYYKVHMPNMPLENLVFLTKMSYWKANRTSSRSFILIRMSILNSKLKNYDLSF